MLHKRNRTMIKSYASKAWHGKFRALAFFFIIISFNASAYETGSYRNSRNAAEDNSDWMSGLFYDTLLSDLSLPGTHATGSYNFGGESIETQSMNVREQLKAGIRAWDMRLGVNHLNAGTQCQGPDLWTFQGIHCQFETFSDILSAADTFLEDHPNEVIVMRVKQENGDIADFAGTVEAEMDAFPGLFYVGNSTNPTLYEVRGMIVLLRDYAESQRGISWASLYTQEEYRISSNSALADKWNSVRNQFIDADNFSDQMYVNFLSAQGGSFPYFVASGKSSWETWAPPLGTGWTEGPFWPFNSCDYDMACIEEFYRTSCTYQVCLVAFKGVNMMARDFIEKSVRVRTGIVMADFPGPSLIGAIIDTNVFM